MMVPANGAQIFQRPSVPKILNMIWAALLNCLTKLKTFGRVGYGGERSLRLVMVVFELVQSITPRPFTPDIKAMPQKSKPAESWMTVLQPQSRKKNQSKHESSYIHVPSDFGT